MDRGHLVDQTKLAFDFLQKLYLEVSYLIKELEGILYEQEEKFIIGRTNGYSVSASSSTGLESNNVSLWLLRKFAVFFVPENKTRTEKGQTVTDFEADLKLLYVRFALNDINVHEPSIYSGILFNIQKKPKAQWIKKFENLMGHMEYNNDRVFKNFDHLDYEDVYIKFQGEFIKNNLYSINDSEAINKKIIEPMLKLYRKA